MVYGSALNAKMFLIFWPLVYVNCVVMLKLRKSNLYAVVKRVPFIVASDGTLRLFSSQVSQPKKKSDHDILFCSTKDKCMWEIYGLQWIFGNLTVTTILQEVTAPN